MGTLHYLCSVVALLTLVAVRQSVSSRDDQCQFIFHEDSVLDVERSQNDGAKVTIDLNVGDKVECAEACCNSEGEWCTLAVFHTKMGPEQMNCFLVQCVPEGSQNNVCVTKHVRHSGFITADVKHLQAQNPRLLDHLLYSKVDSKQRARRSLYPDLLEEHLSRAKIRSHIQTVSSSISDSTSTTPLILSSASRNIAFYSSSSPTVPASSSHVPSTVSSSMSSQTSSSTSPSSSASPSPSPSSSASSSSPSTSPSTSPPSLSSSSSSSSSSSVTPLSSFPSSLPSSRSSTDKNLSLPKIASVPSLPGSNHGNSSMEVTISSSLISAHPSSHTATPPTSPPPPSTTPSIPPPPPPNSSPDTPPESLNASSSTLAPINPSTSASSNPPTSHVISANDSVEALNNLNAALNSSLTSPSSNPAPTSITPKPSPSPAATDIPSHEKPSTAKATIKATTKATTTATTKVTTQVVVADTTPTPKWTSPASVAANKTSDSNATSPINETQSGQDQTKSPEEVISSNINRTTVTQTGILIVTLCFGIIFLLAMMVVVGKRWCEGYQRRKYSKVDYLINGYYS